MEDTVVDEGAGRAERHTLRLAWLQISRIECLIYRCRLVRSGSSVHPGDGGADLHLHLLRGKLEFLHHYCGTPWGGCLRHEIRGRDLSEMAAFGAKGIVGDRGSNEQRRNGRDP